MLLQPTFPRKPLSSVVPAQRVLLSATLLASIKAAKGG